MLPAMASREQQSYETLNFRHIRYVCCASHCKSTEGDDQVNPSPPGNDRVRDLLNGRTINALCTNLELVMVDLLLQLSSGLHRIIMRTISSIHSFADRSRGSQAVGEHAIGRLQLPRVWRSQCALPSPAIDRISCPDCPRMRSCSNPCCVTELPDEQ